MTRHRGRSSSEPGSSYDFEEVLCGSRTMLRVLALALLLEGVSGFQAVAPVASKLRAASSCSVRRNSPALAGWFVLLWCEHPQKTRAVTLCSQRCDI